MPDLTDKSPVISAVDLGKAYAPGQFAIRHVNLEVARHDFVAVVGRSGAGKSTMLRCLNLLVRPTEGRIELACNATGRMTDSRVDITQSSGRRLRDVRGRVGMIFQGFNLVKRLSVLNNVLCGRLRFRSGPLGVPLSTIRFMPGSEREKAFECLRKVGIEHLAYRRADTLSGGQQQRVAIARLLAQESEVILADEPIASLDPRSADTVMCTLREIHETRGIPVVVNLHQVEIARAFASRIVGMAGGRVQVDCSPGELTNRDVDGIYHPPGRDPAPVPAEALAESRVGRGGVVAARLPRRASSADRLIATE